ncbi:MAG: protein kinase domain-containing protein [Myxococcota bacterium]
MGVVWRAEDTERGSEVALKTLTELDAEAITRLKNEFRALADIVHPNLVTLYELVAHGGQWFITMELVQGVDFLSWVRPATQVSAHATIAAPSDKSLGPLMPSSSDTFPSFDSRGPGTLAPAGHSPGTVFGAPQAGTPMGAAGWERLRDALPQLVLGVHAIHRAGKQHRDLKPGNVLVTPEGRVVILDFGLVTGAHGEGRYVDPHLSGKAGTPAYMAPEQHAGEPMTEAADWYSLGVMLYQALTGRLPYYSADAFFDGTYTPPPWPSELVAGVPPDLERLCLELLRWRPDQRPRGDEILARLGVAPAPAGADTPPADALFVGREAELAVLAGALADHRAGAAVRVWVEGRSGQGKSALLRRFLAPLFDRDDVVVLTGRCHERESVAYKVFDEIVDTLVRYVLNQDWKVARDVVPPDAHLLARLFPVLHRLGDLGDEPTTTLPEPQELARRASRALKEMLARLAARRSLVIFVDDLQWGDLDSARLLGDLFRDPALRALFVVAYRSEEVGQNAVLHALLDAARQGAADDRKITLAPLSSGDAAGLARAIVGPGADVEGIIRESGGSPFFVEELARYARAGHAGVVSLQDVVRARIAALEDDARGLLTSVAVIGRPAPLSLALEVADLAGEGDRAILTLRSAHLVRTAGVRAEGRVEPWHDRIRETVVAGLAGDALRAWHRRIADAHERREPRDAEALAVHWQEAGEPRAAVKYLLSAAEQATRALAFDRAVALYEQALGIAPAPDVEEALADALRNGGRGPEAAKHYLAVAESHGGDRRRELLRRAFEQLLISGHIDQGTEVAKQVLAAVGLSMPESPTGIVVSLLWQRFRVTIRGLKYTERTEAQLGAEERALVDTCWAMANGLSIVDSKLGADFTTRFLRAALDAGEPRRIACALAFEAAHQITSGAAEKAWRLLRDSEAIVQRLGDPHTLAYHHLMRGFVLYFQGRYAEARDADDAGAKLLRERCVGVHWEITTAETFANWSRVYAGDWNQLAERGPMLLEEARQRGNRYAEHGVRVSALICARLGADDLEGARAEHDAATVGWSTRGYQVQDFLNLYMGGWIDLYAGTPGETYRRVLAEWPALGRSLLLQVEDIRYRMHHLRAYTAVAADADLKDAEKSARVVAKVGSRGVDGVAGTIRAGIAFRKGDVAAAIAGLADAAARFEAAGMPLYAAGARLRHGQLAGDQGEVAAAEAEMRRRGIVNATAATRIFVPF